MFEYIVLLVLFGSFALFDIICGIKHESTHKLYTNILFSISCILLCMFAFSRDEVGYDYYSYKEIFLDQGSNLSIEYLYKAINILIAFVFNNFNFFLLFILFLTVIPKVVLIDRYSPYPLFSIYIYYCTIFIIFDMGVLRQAIAISLCMIAFFKLLERKVFLFYGYVILSSFFHVSSLLFLLIKPVAFKKISAKYITLTLIVAFLIGSFVVNLNFIVSSMSYFEFAHNKLITYIDNEKYTFEVGLTIGMLFKILIIYTWLILNRHIDETKFLEIAVFNCFFVSIVGYLIFHNYGIFAGRPFSYFYAFIVFLIPNILKAIKSNLYRFVAAIVFIVLIGYSFLSQLGTEDAEVLLPYRSIFYES